jgi:hypothetical protein
VLPALLIAAACSKPRAFAPTDDFARQHDCPASRVHHSEEGQGRVRVSGCGQSEIYVRTCENRAASVPPAKERPAFVTEQDQRLSGDQFAAAPGQVGCAWSREEMPAVPPGMPGAD